MAEVPGLVPAGVVVEGDGFGVGVAHPGDGLPGGEDAPDGQRDDAGSDDDGDVVGIGDGADGVPVVHPPPKLEGGDAVEEGGEEGVEEDGGEGAALVEAVVRAEFPREGPAVAERFPEVPRNPW